MGVKEYFVMVWTPILPEKQKSPEMGLKKTREVAITKRFFNAIDAWKYILDNHIENYTVHEAECVIDES